MTKRKKLFLLASIIVTLITVPFVYFYVSIYLAFEYPIFAYTGDKSVPPENVVNFENLTLRDLKKDECVNHENKEIYCKYYIIKRSRLSKKALHRELSDFCSWYFESQNEYEEIYFFFYMESLKMPWFWNMEYFGDLEMNESSQIGAYGINKDELSFWNKYKGYGHTSIKEPKIEGK